MKPKYEHIEVCLSEGVNSNAFSIIGAVIKELRHNGISKEDIDQFTKEAMAGNYDELIRCCMRWVNVT